MLYKKKKKTIEKRWLISSTFMLYTAHTYKCTSSPDVRKIHTQPSSLRFLAFNTHSTYGLLLLQFQECGGVNVLLKLWFSRAHVYYSYVWVCWFKYSFISYICMYMWSAAQQHYLFTHTIRLLVCYFVFARALETHQSRGCAAVFVF